MELTTGPLPSLSKTREIAEPQSHATRSFVNPTGRSRFPKRGARPKGDSSINRNARHRNEVGTFSHHELVRKRQSCFWTETTNAALTRSPIRVEFSTVTTVTTPEL